VPTAAIAGLLHRRRVDHPRLEGATAFTWRAVDAIAETNPYEVRIEASLDALAAGQQPDGGWTVGWPAWTEAAGLEWRTWVTVHNLGVLRAYGRLG
jgi:hypothetical protein